jgi:hypothetical protein
MKKLIVVATLLALVAVPARAETVRTCSSVYGGGEVCGETNENTTTVVHEVVETGVADNEAFKILMSIASAAALATGLYKLTYKSYILG